MDQFKFSTEHSIMIVDAIVAGYRDYIEHRKDRKEKMIISSAFAWTKGNFIESKIAEDCQSHGFTYRHSKAGPTWHYLQFVQGDNESKILFLIKNGDYFNETSFSLSQSPIPGLGDKKARTYLHELSKINQDLPFPSEGEPGGRSVNTEQISFGFIPEKMVKEELEENQTEYKEFHILTYELDKAQQIQGIRHYLPNPADNKAYLIEDLSEFISGAELTDDERAAIAPEQLEAALNPEFFDLGIIEDERENE